jgi:predicted hotdog family 3-hydroxylacyl-ACP dehydratase
MSLDRRQIERVVPHAGAMCLLDAVTQWDETQLTCTCAAPGAEHPLADKGRVPAVAACEYAAQATAVHGALIDALQSPRAGMLASLIDVRLHEAWFPAGDGEVLVQASLRIRTGDACLYSFEVSAAGVALVDGQLMVAFRAPQPA